MHQIEQIGCAGDGSAWKITTGFKRIDESNEGVFEFRRTIQSRPIPPGQTPFLVQLRQDVITRRFVLRRAVLKLHRNLLASMGGQHLVAEIVAHVDDIGAQGHLCGDVD